MVLINYVVALNPDTPTHSKTMMIFVTCYMTECYNTTEHTEQHHIHPFLDLQHSYSKNCNIKLIIISQFYCLGLSGLAGRLLIGINRRRSVQYEKGELP